MLFFISYVQHLLTIATGDTHLLHAAQAQARGAFRENASLAPEDPLAAKAITHAKEVSAILRENIVQGKNVGDNKYSRCLCSYPSTPYIVSRAFLKEYVYGVICTEANNGRRITDTR